MVMTERKIYTGEVMFNGNYYFAGEKIKGTLEIINGHTYLNTQELDSLGNVIREGCIRVWIPRV
jgi:hypothetical protein